MVVRYRIPYSNELWHHGIKGQKWGVRRFQNPDGSLTEAGSKRYERKFDKEYGKGSFKKEIDSENESVLRIAESFKGVSDKELKRLAYEAVNISAVSSNKRQELLSLGKQYTREYFENDRISRIAAASASAARKEASRRIYGQAMLRRESKRKNPDSVLNDFHYTDEESARQDYDFYRTKEFPETKMTYEQFKDWYYV